MVKGSMLVFNRLQVWGCIHIVSSTSTCSGTCYSYEWSLY